MPDGARADLFEWRRRLKVLAAAVVNQKRWVPSQPPIHMP